MAYAPHIRCQAQGTFSNTNEIWSLSINLANAEVPGPNAGFPGLQPNSDVFDDIAADFGTWISTNPYVSGFAVLRSVKMAFIGTDGKYDRAPELREVVAQGGGGSGYTYPLQVALACTFLTDTPLQKVRGRIYLPAPTAALGTDGRISAVDAETIRDNVDGFLQNLGNQPGIDVLGLVPVVASTKGVNHKITGVKVGRAYDTIRTRRNRLLEAYTDPSVVTT